MILQTIDIRNAIHDGCRVPKLPVSPQQVSGVQREKLDSLGEPDNRSQVTGSIA